MFLLQAVCGMAWLGLSSNQASPNPSSLLFCQVDQINRQVASRIASSAFSTWRRLDSERQSMIKQHLQHILSTNGISENVNEIVSKTLKV